jgi:Cu/Ag efflux protein CusF
MKTARRLVAAALLAASAPVLLAQVPMSDGEVRKVDRDNRKVTMKAGEIKNIDMPPMTMDFVVRDAKMLDKLQAGDKVRFRAINDGGKFTITELEPKK